MRQLQIQTREMYWDNIPGGRAASSRSHRRWIGRLSQRSAAIGRVCNRRLRNYKRTEQLLNNGGKP